MRAFVISFETVGEGLAKWKGRWPLEAHGPRVHPHRGALVRFLDELATWNAKLDLTAAKSPEEFCDLMLADACALAEALPERATVVDVGTGAGGPAVTLAILRPDLSFTLVEPLAKRTAFLRTALAAVSRSDVVVVRGRGEELTSRESKWDVAMSRATLAPPDWLALGTELVRPAGMVAVLLAKEEAPVGERAELAQTMHYTLVSSGASRTLALYRRHA